MSFTKKYITLVFTLDTLAEGSAAFAKGSAASEMTSTPATFPGTNAEQVTIQGLRVSCYIAKTAAPAMNACHLLIYGLLPSVYNTLASLYNVTQNVAQSSVTVMAGEDADHLAVIFTGQITVAQIDLNQQPDCVMQIVAQSAYLQNLTPVVPTVYPGSFDVATAMQSLAQLMALQFENNGVQVKLSGMTLSGTAREQALKLQEAARIGLGFDDTTLVIYPQGGSRAATQQPVVISAGNGMIGYPSYSTHGIELKTLFNPAVKWQGQIELQSSLQMTSLNGLWTVFGLTHHLESETPEGKWETEIQAANFTTLASRLNYGA